MKQEERGKLGYILFSDSCIFLSKVRSQVRAISQYAQLGNIKSQEKAKYITKVIAWKKKYCYNAKFEIYRTIKTAT